MSATNSPAFHMTAPPGVYRARRARVGEKLRRPLVVPAGRPRARNYQGNDFPFRAASTYLYFGGPPIDGAAWLIEPGNDGDKGCRLMRPSVGPDHAVWFGEAPDDEAIASAAGVSQSALGEPDRLYEWLAGRAAACICPPCAETARWVNEAGLESANPDELIAIIDMRLIKDEHELAAMRRAAHVNVEAHLAAMRDTQSGRRAADVAAAFQSVLIAHDYAPSFTPIVTTQGEVLHPSGYGEALAAGKLLLLDGGAEEPSGYACDVTRVWPVSGTFTPAQRQMYKIVLRAQQAAITACVPGTRYRDVHDLAGRVICDGLVEAELLRGDPAELATRRAHTLFFTHGVGHLIGLDVHDMEDYGDWAGYAHGRTRRTGFGDKYLRLDRDLEAGMTMTIEPGVYFVPAVWRRDDLVKPLADCVNRRAVDALLRESFGGIRIEDTVHVRASGGPEVLSRDLPVEAEAVEAAVAGG